MHCTPARLAVQTSPPRTIGAGDYRLATLCDHALVIIDRVADHLANMARRPQTNPGYPPTTPWVPPERPDANGTAPLPTRRSSPT